MARSTILGNEILLYIDTVTPLTARPVDDDDYKLIACIASNGINSAQSDIDTTSKCSGVFTESDAGDITWSMSGTGNAVDDAGPSEQGYNELFALHLGRGKFWAKMANLDNSIIREGIVRIASFDETYERNAPFKFTLSLHGSGELYILQLT